MSDVEIFCVSVSVGVLHQHTNTPTNQRAPLTDNNPTLVLNLSYKPGMKTIPFIYALALILGIAAPWQQAEVKRVEFRKFTRGYDENISITPDSLHVWIDNSRAGKPESYSRVVTKEEWIGLLSLIQELPLKEIPSLPSPTMQRASDGAMHSTITIHAGDGQSYAHGFDNYDPHPDLHPLLDKIREISGTKGR